MVVDIHTHFVPEVFPEMGDRPGGDRWPRMNRLDARRGQVMISGRNFRTVTDECWSVERRLQEMDEFGIARHAVSPMPELLTYWAESTDARDFGRHMNEQLVRLVQQAPDRFSGLGMLPMQDPDMAARELAHVKSLGLQGVEIGSNIRGRPIGDPSYLPFFAEAASQGLAVFVHAFHPLGEERLVGPGTLDNFIGFPLDTAFATASLITGGVLARYPNVRIACSHGGGGFAMVLPRLNHGWSISEELHAALPLRPEEYARRLYFDTLVYDPRTLRYLMDLVGVSQLAVGSDYPFMIREKPAGKVLSDLTDLTTADREAMTTGNALRFLGLG